MPSFTILENMTCPIRSHPLPAAKTLFQTSTKLPSSMPFTMHTFPAAEMSTWPRVVKAQVTPTFTCSVQPARFLIWDGSNTVITLVTHQHH